MAKKYRVIQWATGSVGQEALKGILMHPRLELAGVRVYADEKVGLDAGELCGLPVTGVRATAQLDEVLACQADCVAYMPRLVDLDDVCALLASGKNVICTPFLFFPEGQPEADRARLRRACAEGKSSVYGTGIHPGFAGMVLPLALSGMSREIRHVLIQERADWTYYNSPRITFDNMRFGGPAEAATLEANPFARFNSTLFQDQILMLAAALGAELDEVEVEQDLRVSAETYDVLAGRVEEGTVSGQRYRWRGMCGGKTLIEIDALWTLGGPYPTDWPKPKNGWTVTIEGEPSSRAHFIGLASFERRDATIEEHVHSADIATAMQAVNSIPSLCDAPTGLRAAYELAPVYSGIGFRDALSEIASDDRAD